MSHKIAAPPIGPFYERVVYADADSTSQDEDGRSWTPPTLPDGVFYSVRHAPHHDGGGFTERFMP